MGAWSLSNQLFASLTAYLACILGGSYQHCYIHVAEWWVAIFYSIKKINLHHICTQWCLSQGHELTAHSTRFHHWPWSELMPSYSFLQSYILSYFCVYVQYIYTAENRCIPNYGRQAVVEDNILLKILIGRTLSKITISKLSQGSWYIYIYIYIYICIYWLWIGLLLREILVVD